MANATLLGIALCYLCFQARAIWIARQSLRGVISLDDATRRDSDGEEADLDGFDSWAAAPARAAFSFLSASGRFAIAQGRAATLVQVTGGSARRALPGRGLWAAGSFGVRAITNAAALELRPRGIQVSLLIVDAVNQPLDGSTRGGVSPEALADPRRIAEAVLFLANQHARAATHELQITPLARELDALTSGASQSR